MADYTQFPIRDEFDDFQVCEKESFPQDLIVKIEDWNDRYKKLLPLNYSSALLERASILDQEGEFLVKEIEKYFDGNAKVKYLSAI